MTDFRDHKMFRNVSSNPLPSFSDQKTDVWGPQDVPKRWYPSTRLYAITSQKTVNLNIHCLENLKKKDVLNDVTIVKLMKKKKLLVN
jgi:hypothetical protein